MGNIGLNVGDLAAQFAQIQWRELLRDAGIALSQPVV